MRRTTTTHAALTAANPVPHPQPGIDARAEADLRRILATDPEHARADAPGPDRWPAGRRATRTAARWAAVAAVTTALVVGGSVLDGDGWLPGGQREGSAYAVTPPPLAPGALDGLSAYGLAVPTDPTDPAPVLTQIADRVQPLPDDTGTGRYARVANEGWYLHTRVDGRQVTSEIVLTATTSWTAADGSGALRSRVGDQDPSEEAFGPGGRSLVFALGGLSTDPSTLATQLEVAHPVANGPAERLVAITDLAREQPLPPAVRAAVLRYLAATPGLLLTGPVEDRSGRRGVAVHLDSDHSGLPTRYTLIIDPASGRLLGDEQLLTTTAGALNVPVPSVIAYTTHLDARYVDDAP